MKCEADDFAELLLCEAPQTSIVAATPSRALEIGKAAEHLVCADLILQGYTTYLTDQGLPYDVVVDLNGKLLRIQVKGTCAPRVIPDTPHTKKYMWHVRRAGKGAKRIIGNDEFDVLALVALDIKQIAYMRLDDKVPQSFAVKPPGTPPGFTVSQHTRIKCIDEFPFREAISEFQQ